MKLNPIKVLALSNYGTADEPKYPKKNWSRLFQLAKKTTKFTNKLTLAYTFDPGTPQKSSWTNIFNFPNMAEAAGWLQKS